MSLLSAMRRSRALVLYVALVLLARATAIQQCGGVDNCPVEACTTGSDVCDLGIIAQEEYVFIGNTELRGVAHGDRDDCGVCQDTQGAVIRFDVAEGTVLRLQTSTCTEDNGDADFDSVMSLSSVTSGCMAFDDDNADCQFDLTRLSSQLLLPGTYELLLCGVGAVPFGEFELVFEKVTEYKGVPCGGVDNCPVEACDASTAVCNLGDITPNQYTFEGDSFERPVTIESDACGVCEGIASQGAAIQFSVAEGTMLSLESSTCIDGSNRADFDAILSLSSTEAGCIRYSDDVEGCGFAPSIGYIELMPGTYELLLCGFGVAPFAIDFKAGRRSLPATPPTMEPRDDVDPPTPEPRQPEAVGDPHFIGFDGYAFDFEGLAPGSVFNVFSAAGLQISAALVPELHDGLTYIGAVGITVPHVRVAVSAESETASLLLEINDEVLPAGETAEGAGVSVDHIDRQSIRVTIDAFLSMTFTMRHDRFIDITGLDLLMQPGERMIDGVLGQTAILDRKYTGFAGVESDYIVASLFDTSFKLHNCYTPSVGVQSSAESRQRSRSVRLFGH